MRLDLPVGQIAGVGAKMAGRLRRLEIKTARDLILHFPVRYEDFSQTTPISQLKPGIFCIKGQILEIKNQRSPKGRMFLTYGLISDQSGTIRVLWFNQPFLTRVLKKGEEIVLVGKVVYEHSSLFLKNPSYEKEPGILPVYPETEGLSSKWLRKIIKPLLLSTAPMEDYLPEKVKRAQGLIELKTALRQIHFPDFQERAESARKRLSFDELFLIQLKMLKMKKNWQENKAPAMKFDQELVRSLVARLPFKLTNAQRKAAWEIILDLQKPRPMNRLLEGDVGSGKTVVAAMAMLLAAKNDYQSVLLVPTEILAIQHFNNLTKLLEDFGISIGLLTAGKKEKSIKDADIIIGTHALLQEKVKFKNLGLAVIDEQHRFGVKQRAVLRQRSSIYPHLLSMSATPIPRTLSLALYGDLDLSILDEMPAGRQKVATRLVFPTKRADAYEFIRKKIKEGRQVFVICPLIEESDPSRLGSSWPKSGLAETDKLGVRAATAEYQKLKTDIFPDLKIALLHGKMKTKEKEKIMADFKTRKRDILVSTAVVEVGVDVPNAAVMLIEGAERFGLAQLHQFRGRVGRANHKSYCFVFTETAGRKTSQRLKALVNLDDGFKLAEKDLELRGPGELYGIKQHGFWDLKIATLNDRLLIQEAKKEAEKIIKQGLEHYPKLSKEIGEIGD